MNHLPYRPCVGMMVLNAKNQVFVAKRIDTKLDAWQMPQGGIDEGEQPSTAVMRELEEEIGTHKATIIAESREWLSYDLPEKLVPTIWGGKYRGQTQKWFLLRFTGVDADINIETKIPEFSHWKWTQPSTLPEIIVPFKKQLYTNVLEEFKSHLSS